MTQEQIKRAIKHFTELKDFVDDYDGNFDELHCELVGHNMSEDCFDTNYKSICASIYSNMGCFYVSCIIDVYDDESGEMLSMSVNDLKKKIVGEEDKRGENERVFHNALNKLRRECDDYLREILKGRTKKMLDLNGAYIQHNGYKRECRSIVLDNDGNVRLELGLGDMCAIKDLDGESVLNLWGNVRDKMTAPPEQEEKEVRIKFSASVYIKGKTMREIREKWENCTLLPEDTDDVFHEFDERLLVEDAETNEDLSKEFDDYQEMMYEV